jgi:hypothetical protein
MKNTEKITAEEVEVVNTAEEKDPPITRVRVDDDSGNKTGAPSVEDFLEQMKKNGGEGMEDNPMMKMLGNVAEIKKIKVYFLFSLLFGFIGLFGFRIYMGPLAILLGVVDLMLGSKLTQKASYVGIIFGLLSLILHFG